MTKYLSTCVVLTMTLALACSQAFAQAYSNRPVRIIVAFQAGQGTDVATRQIGNQLSGDVPSAVAGLGEYEGRYPLNL